MIQRHSKSPGLQGSSSFSQRFVRKQSSCSAGRREVALQLVQAERTQNHFLRLMAAVCDRENLGQRHERVGMAVDRICASDELQGLQSKAFSLVNLVVPRQDLCLNRSPGEC